MSYHDDNYFGDSLDGVSVVLTQCFIQEREPSSDQHIRPSMTNFQDGRVIDNLLRETQGYSNLSNRTIRRAGIHNAMGYSGVSDGIAAINNGWRARRAYVRMVFEIKNDFASATKVITINGYTDKYEFIPGYGLSDDTYIWFNDLEEDDVLDTDDGQRIRVSNSNSIRRGLLRRTDPTDRPLETSQYSLRAPDIIGEIRGREISNRHDGGYNLNQTAALRNTQLATRPTDLAPDNFLGGVLRGVRDVSHDQQLSGVNNHSIFITSVRTQLEDYANGPGASGVRSDLFEFLSSQSDYGNPHAQRGTDCTRLFALSMQKLRDLFPDLDRVTISSELEFDEGHYDTANWGASSALAVAANVVRDAIVMVAAKFDVGEINFELHGIGDQFDIRITHILYTKESAAERPHVLDDIESDLSYYIYRRVSRDGQIAVELNANAHIGGMFQFEIAFDNGQFEHYSAPIYMRQAYAAEMTRRHSLVDEAVNDFNSILGSYRDRATDLDEPNNC